MIRIFPKSAESEIEIRRVIDRHLDAIKEIQAVLDRKPKDGNWKENDAKSTD
ncbi:MAG: hypothetical protein PHW79_00170 [Candidatus Marinimicrobia bacterium]|nr:hypothetical protein [Candidatus Neomarinimicrobiota bacterium]